MVSYVVVAKQPEVELPVDAATSTVLSVHGCFCDSLFPLNAGLSISGFRDQEFGPSWMIGWLHFADQVALSDD